VWAVVGELAGADAGIDAGLVVVAGAGDGVTMTGGAMTGGVEVLGSAFSPSMISRSKNRPPPVSSNIEVSTYDSPGRMSS